RGRWVTDAMETPDPALTAGGIDWGQTMTGTVRWWKDEKGYGRITGDDGYVYFAHFSGIEGGGYRNLIEGQRVQFEWLGSRAAHGRKAVQRVRPLATATESPLKPFGRIFLFEGHDLAVRPDSSAAERWIEPYDV